MEKDIKKKLKAMFDESTKPFADKFSKELKSLKKVMYKYIDDSNDAMKKEFDNKVLKADKSGAIILPNEAESRYFVKDKDPATGADREVYNIKQMIEDKVNFSNRTIFADALLPVPSINGLDVLTTDRIRTMLAKDPFIDLARKLIAPVHSFKENTISGLVFKQQDDASVNPEAQGITYSTKMIQIVTNVALIRIALETIKDNPNIIADVIYEILLGASKKQRTDSIAAVKAGATVNVTKSGVEDAHPTAANTPQLVRDMILSVDDEFQDPNATVLILSQKMISLLKSGAATSFGNDFTSRLETFEGVRILQKHMEAGDTDGHIVGAFGNFNEAIASHMAESFSITDETGAMGALGKYARYGIHTQVRLPKAMATFIIGE